MRWVIVLALLLLASPVLAFHGMGPGPGTKTYASAAASYLVDEGYEGTGYEESWTESVGSGCTLNEDSAGPGTLPTGGGSQCLHVGKGAGTVSVYSRHDYGTTIPTAYVRFYLYVDTTSMGANETLDHIVTATNAAADAATFGVKLGTDGSGNLSLQPNYHTGSWSNLPAATINLDQWYRVEFLLNTTGGVVEWRLNGVSQGSASGLTFPRGAARYFQAGVMYQYFSPTATIYIDRFAVSDTGWIGE